MIAADETLRSLHRLNNWLTEMESILVAYSGGVDSAVVLAAACRQLPDCALGVIGNSPSLPASELQAALDLAAQRNFPVRVIQTTEHLDPLYAANTGDRCFHCRRHLFQRLTEMAAKEGFNCVADGVHAGDLTDHIGGMRAARQFGVRSPLLELGLNKSAVRAMADFLDLPVRDKPAAACLASRIPVGTAVTVSLLEKIAAAEEVLRRLGFRDFRVRHHGPLARIELPGAQIPALLDCREKIISALQAIGYEHITLDLKARAPE